MATEVFQGSAEPRSPENGAYVAGVHAASRALILNAVLMTGTTYLIPRAMALLGRGRLWCLATLATALLLLSSLAIKSGHAKVGAGWGAKCGGWRRESMENVGNPALNGRWKLRKPT